MKKTALKKPAAFRYVEETWDSWWAEFWRIRLIEGDEVTAWKYQQVVLFCSEVLSLKKGMTLLDLGCGAGFQAELFAEAGIKVHGIDICKKLVDHAAVRAKRSGSGATFTVGDMRSFSVPRPFDRVVVLGMSFGFGNDDDNRAALKNVFRAVKPGGMILITGQHPYYATQHIGPEYMETAEGLLYHHGEFNPITSRLNGSWQLARPDGVILTEGENPESEGIRCYSVPEMKALLQECGFRAPEFYGSWFLPPAELQYFSLEMITVARRP